MCTGHDDAAGPGEVARLSCRGSCARRPPPPPPSVPRARLRRRRWPRRTSRARRATAGTGCRLDQISIQLFTLRDQLAIDLEGTLAALAEIGYTRVEHVGFVGVTVTEFKAALDAAGLRATPATSRSPSRSTRPPGVRRWPTPTRWGSRYIVHPFFGINFATGEVVRTTALRRAFARDLNRAGRMARDAGLKLGYHNHNWEFFRLTDDPSRTAYDVLTDVTDPDLSTCSSTCSGRPEGRATRSTSSTRTRAGCCSTTSRT